MKTGNIVTPAMEMVIYTFGDYARWHPHIHVLIATAFS